jgi:hypothetical protein
MIRSDVRDLLEPMLATGLSPALTTALRELAFSVPQLKKEISEGNKMCTQRICQKWRLYTSLYFLTDYCQQNMQWIWSNPLTCKDYWMFVGYNRTLVTMCHHPSHSIAAATCSSWYLTFHKLGLKHSISSNRWPCGLLTLFAPFIKGSHYSLRFAIFSFFSLSVLVNCSIYLVFISVWAFSLFLFYLAYSLYHSNHMSHLPKCCIQKQCGKWGLPYQTVVALFSLRSPGSLPGCFLWVCDGQRGIGAQFSKHVNFMK